MKTMTVSKPRQDPIILFLGDEEANGIEETTYFTSNGRIIAGRDNGLVCGGVETFVRRIVPS